MASLSEIVEYLDAELRTAEIPDYPAAFNGLQLANSGKVSHVAATVDFSIKVCREVVERGADLLILHHGMFWSGSAPITGPRHECLSLLLGNDVAVYGSHLPLDLHALFGNNVLLAKELGLVPTGGFASSRGVEIGVSGTSSIATAELARKVEQFCGTHGHHLVTTPIESGRVTTRWGICTGAGASTETILEATDRHLDTIIVGEGPHHTAVQAEDRGLVVMYAGHYATETLGVRALSVEVARRFEVESSFIEAPTGL
jgi:dinuclear metal center YbgI/SA1388 family protein